MVLAALATPLALCVELDAAAEGQVQPDRAVSISWFKWGNAGQGHWETMMADRPPALPIAGYGWVAFLK